MSDEPPPPPELRLRLKPRPDKAGDPPPPSSTEPPGSTPPVAPPAPAAPPAEAASPAPGKIKLRMRTPLPLPVDEPPPAAPAAPPPAAAPSSQPAPAGGPAANEAAAPSPDRIKLRMRLQEKAAPPVVTPEPSLPTLPPMAPVLGKADAPAGTSSPAAPPKIGSGPPPPTEAGSRAKSEPPLPTLPPLPGKTEPPIAADGPLPLPTGGPPPVIAAGLRKSGDGASPNLPPPVIAAGREGTEAGPHLKLRSDTILPGAVPPPGGSRKSAAPMPAAAKPSSTKDSLGVFVRVTGLLLILAVVYLVYRRYTQMPRAETPPPAPAAAAKPAPSAAKTAPTAAKTVSASPQSLPGRMVEKARETVALAERGTAATNEVIESEPVRPAARPTPPPRPEPSARFRSVVDRLKIAGFRAGPPARLVVSGVTYQPGDTIDANLGVVFAGFDAKTHELIFQDNTGAEIRRQF